MSGFGIARSNSPGIAPPGVCVAVSGTVKCCQRIKEGLRPLRKAPSQVTLCLVRYPLSETAVIGRTLPGLKTVGDTASAPFGGEGTP